MNVAIITDYAPLTGDLCRVWQKFFSARGDRVDFIPMGCGDDSPLLPPEDVDLNLMIAGMFLVKRISKQGLPARGRNILWVIDPCPEDDVGVLHREYVAPLDIFGNKCDGIIGFDASVIRYCERHFPEVPAFEIPYVIDSHRILAPLPDAARPIHVLHLAHMCPRRDAAEAMLIAAGVPMVTIHGGVWDERRDEVWASTRVTLQIHLDDPFYFDAWRTFEALRVGSVVLAEPTVHFSRYGVVPGKHLVAAPLKEFPAVCRELLNDPQRRYKIASAAQELLRERYVPELYYETLERAIGAALTGR